MTITKTQIKIKLDEARKDVRNHLLKTHNFKTSYLRCETGDYSIVALESRRFMIKASIFYYYREPNGQPKQGFIDSIVYTKQRAK